MNKKLGIALALLGSSGITVALLHLLGINQTIASYITACLSLVVMIYGMWLLLELLKFDSRRENSNTEKQVDAKTLAKRFTIETMSVGVQ